jgi:flagellar basal-body rod protein FlgF/flagellar basal-body rod protein FlgG
MEVLSNNLANVDTPGFKRDLALFWARHAEETARGVDHQGSGSINDVGGGVWMHHTATDYSQGILKRTDIKTDMAVNGDGYFVVQKDGQNYLTRAGNFMVNADGFLVTQTGHSVMSDGGAPIVINPDTDWRVSPDGAIEQDGGKNYLALVVPPSPGDLAKHSENLFQALGPTNPVATELRSVQGGYVEMSGVKPSLEMLELIETSRAFEMNVSMIRNHDSMLNSLVNRVLRQA